MADMAHLIEPVIPALRRYARTFVRDAAAADDFLGAVGQLPDDQRSVLLLVSIEDVSYAEAARILDIQTYGGYPSWLSTSR